MKVCILIIFLALSLTESMGQSRADRLFERGDYLGALKLYRKDLEGERANDDKLKARVANCFFHMNDVVRAGQMYKSVNQDLLEAEDLLFYATTLQRSGEYDKALKMLDAVESAGGDVTAIENLKESCQFARKMAKEKPIYAANKTNVNFAGFSSGATYYKGRGVIIAAPGNGDNADSRGYKFTRLYNAVFAEDGKGGSMAPFANELVDKYHVGAVTFTKDFKRIYYTKIILKKDGSSILKLMTAEDDGGVWTNIKELNINSDDYSCAHPSLYRDTLLFFVSDMPGGMGGKDVYMTAVDGETCGDMVNLGETVNTAGDELFPVIDMDENLYFSSNGRVGLGGLDVYRSKMLDGGSWSEPENMGRPINSSMDDFGLVFRDTKCKEGFVSSNRGGTGYDDFLFALKSLPNREMKKSPETKQEEVKKEVVPVVPKQEMFAVDYRYAIQVGAFRNPVPRVYFEHFPNVKVYQGFDNIYRYAVGEYPEEGIADIELAEVRKTIHDAFVINVDTYQKDRKIQHGIKGDDVSDDELLLIRLKKLEMQRKTAPSKPVSAPRTTKRYLDKPREVPVMDGYTVVLMSADNVMDISALKGVDNVEVFAINGGQFMYCSGLYEDPTEAKTQLSRIKQKGFPGAYIIHTGEDGGEFTENISSSRPKESGVRKQELKTLLNY